MSGALTALALLFLVALVVAVGIGLEKRERL